MYFYVVPFLTLLNALCACAVFEYKDCTPPGSPLNVSKLDVTPNPVILPGDIQLTLEGSSSAPVGGASLSLSLTRKSFIDIHIPCILNVGSCTYDDICTLPDQMVTQNWAGVTGSIGTQIKQMLRDQGLNPSSCPYPPATVNIENFTFKLPPVPAVLASFAAGDYEIHVSVVEKSSGKEILCLDALVHFKHGCSGLSCIFG